MTPQQLLRTFRTYLICVIGTAVFLDLILSRWPFAVVSLAGVAVIIAALWSQWRQQ